MRIVTLAVFAAVIAVSKSATFEIFQSLETKNELKAFQHKDLPGHKLRLKSTNETICAGSEGVAGYLDIGAYYKFSKISYLNLG